MIKFCTSVAYNLGSETKRATGTPMYHGQSDNAGKCLDPIYSPRLRVRVIRQSSSGSVLVIYVNILSIKQEGFGVSLPHLTTTGLITDPLQSFAVLSSSLHLRHCIDCTFWPTGERSYGVLTRVLVTVLQRYTIDTRTLVAIVVWKAWPRQCC